MPTPVPGRIQARATLSAIRTTSVGLVLFWISFLVLDLTSKTESRLFRSRFPLPAVPNPHARQDRKRYMEFAESELPSRKRRRLEEPPAEEEPAAPNPANEPWDHQTYKAAVRRSFQALYASMQ